MIHMDSTSTDFFSQVMQDDLLDQVSPLEDDSEDDIEEATEQSELHVVKDALASTKDQLLRSLAEVENMRKRLDKERSDATKYAVTNFARDMLSVGDNLSRALDAAHNAGADQDVLKELLEGVALTQSELNRIFGLHGIEAVATENEKFDSQKHQAIMEVESDLGAGAIVQCLQSGYMLKDRLLRPAMVTVSKKKESTNRDISVEQHTDALVAEAVAEAI